MVRPIPRPTGHKLTGRQRHRTNWRKKLILQVEIGYYTYEWSDHGINGPGSSGPLSFWRDATVDDISEGKLV